MISSPRFRKIASFLLALAMVGLIWLVVLPSSAKRPAMRAHLRWLDDQGIDPSAMYYTELELMEKILARRRAEELAKRFANKSK